MRSITLLWKRAVQLYTKDIWLASHIGERSLRGAGYAVLRVISITITGIFATRAFARAAALSFTSLLSMGPLIALAFLVAGFVYNKPAEQDMIANKINDMIQFIAPQVEHFEEIRQQQHEEHVPEAGAGSAEHEAGEHEAAANENAARETAATGVKTNADANMPEAGAPTAAIATANTNDVGAVSQPRAGSRKAPPGISKLINNFATSARSGTVGGLSFITLVVIIVLLFGAIEDVFNDIWGVRRTRSWLTRIVFYWAILTLGTVIFSAALGTLSAASLVNIFRDKLPFGPQMFMVIRFILPALAGVVIVGLLTLFYRFVPNTHVYWRAAFAGALTMCVLLVGNNMVAFAYFKRIEITQSLYGSLGIVPVLMFGLYVFWFIVLVGGQVSYAVQNVHFRNSQAAWTTLSHSTRERLSLVVLLTIARRFQACMPPCTVSQLGATIKTPTQILNECLNRLIDLKLVSPVPPASKDEASSNFLYQPARPLNRITLGDFKELFENMGVDPSTTAMIDQIDPVVAQYQDAVFSLNHNELFGKTLEQLFAENPMDDTHPPFALGQKVKKQE
jgi:membrane protein